MPGPQSRVKAQFMGPLLSSLVRREIPWTNHVITAVSAADAALDGDVL